MGRVLVGHGGSGSAAMILRIREAGGVCHGRPDVAFFPADTPRLTVSAREAMQILSPRGYADRPTPEAAAIFARRAEGYRFDVGTSIGDNLRAYVRHVESGPAHTWLCRAPLFGFLTSAEITGAVCLVRHPLHQYLSFTQPYRHPDWSDAHGGRASPDAISTFARAWSAFTADCLGCGGRIIRYERAGEDAAGDPFLERLFEPLYSTKHYERVLPEARERQLCEETEGVWTRLYAEWRATDAAPRPGGA